MQKKSFIGLSNMVAYTMVVLGLVALVNYISAQHYKRFDFTKYRSYSLSSQTEKLIGRLPYEVKVTLFIKNNPAIRRGPKKILQQYEYYGDKFKWMLVDPDKKPDLAKKFDITQYNIYVVEGRHGKKETFSGEFTEEKLTNAIIRIISTKEKVIYFSRGHGEKNLDGTDSVGYDEIRSTLKKENFLVKDLLLYSKGGPPEDAAVIVVAGPQKDLSGYEIRKLENYISDGGKVVLMADPFVLDETLKFVEQYGIKIHNDVIVDRSSRMFGGDILIPTVANYQSHRITDEFRLTTLYPLARSLEFNETPGSGIKVQGLGITLPKTWGETSKQELQDGEAVFVEGKDYKGPLYLSAVATIKRSGKPKAAETDADGEKEDKKGSGAIVVIGDSDFIANSHIRLSGNRDFFMNVINWLAGEEDRIAIRAREIPMDPIRFTIPQLYTIAGISVVGVPGLVLIVGIWINIRRRRS